MKKKRLIIPLILIAAVAVSVICILLFFAGSESMKEKSIESFDKQITEYTLSDDGDHIANIPEEDYIKSSKPKGKVVTVEGLKPNNNYYENTELIQTAINDLSEKEKGGTVCIPEGEFLITGLELKSNITLFLSPRCSLYSLTALEYSADNEAPTAVIIADKAENITITGGGAICGWGNSFLSTAENEKPFYALKTFNLYTAVSQSKKRLKPAIDENVQPALFNFKNCENITFSSVKIKDSASNAIEFSKCKNITVKNLVIDNNLYSENSGGILLDGCTNVKVGQCFISTGGDGVRIETSSKKALNIKVSACEICSFCSCVRIGDKTNNNIQAIDIDNCSFFVPDGICSLNTGLDIESADGSKISSVTINNIEMNGVSSPLLIWLGDRLNLKKKEIGSIHDIIISDISATDIELPCVITGCEGKEIYDITLSNFDLSYRESGEELETKNIHDLSAEPDIINVAAKPAKSIEKSLYYSVPAYGLFLRFTDSESINIDKFECTARSCSSLSKITDNDNILYH